MILYFDKNFFFVIRIIEILGKIIFFLFYYDFDKYVFFIFLFWVFFSLGEDKKLVSKLEKNLLFWVVM